MKIAIDNNNHSTERKFARRLRLALVVWLGLSAGAVYAQAASQPDDGDSQPGLMDILVQKAKALSEHPYQPPQKTVPDFLANLDYDQYRDIRFNPDKALWRNQGLFEVQLLPPGFIYKTTVGLQMVDRDGATSRIPFDSKYFTYGDPNLRDLADKAGTHFGYSGFRVHFPLNTPNYKDEIAVFQGASYFRLVGPGQVYGLSARGLAIDTAEPSGEEFPRFTEFWLIQPPPDSHQMVIFALLDSPSISGVYRFKLGASLATTVDVDCVLFPRKDIKKVGIAPLTSMFFFGEAGLRHHDDIRHEVHDSDGLLMQTSNNLWIWRPLANPKTLQVTSLLDHDPLGFGLAQRDRNFNDYLDIEARYQDRPSLWVRPRGNWGDGRVELVEIPSDQETNDNIVAYWVPQEPFRAGQRYQFSYTLSTFNRIARQPRLASVIRTLIGWGAIPGQPNPPPHSLRQFAIDFSGGPLEDLPDTTPLAADVETSAGTISDVTVKHLPGDHAWRVAFRLQPKQNTPADMRLYLHLRGERVSEEWSYVWNPNTINQ